MIKHIIAVFATILALWAMYVVYQSDKEVDKLENIHKIIAKSQIKVKLDKPKQSIIQDEAVDTQSVNVMNEEEVKKKKEIERKLQALKNKAGNIAAFKVSPLYKQKCSSCHGVNGEGIIGPKLIGHDSQYIYQALIDFKSGKRRNYVMYGLLSKMNDEQLKQLANEIGTFEQKLQNVQN